MLHPFLIFLKRFIQGFMVFLFCTFSTYLLVHMGSFYLQTTFKGRVFMTHATKAIYKLLLSDYVKVSKVSVEDMLFDEHDILHSMEKIEVCFQHPMLDLHAVVWLVIRIIDSYSCEVLVWKQVLHWTTYFHSITSLCCTSGPHVDLLEVLLSWITLWISSLLFISFLEEKTLFCIGFFQVLHKVLSLE